MITASRSALLLRGQLSFLQANGFTIGLVASDGPQLRKTAEEEGVEVFPLPFEREMSPLRDAVALLQLHSLIRSWKPDVVIAATPKAGLLGMLAAKQAGVPHRIYHLWGLPWESRSGIKKRILGATEKLASACAHEVWPVSHSLQESYVGADFCSLEKTHVIAQGSSNGINPELFAPPSVIQREKLRAELELPSNVPVLGYVGRLTPDKGFRALWESYLNTRKSFPKTHLLVVGDVDFSTPAMESILHEMRNDSQVRLTGLIENPAPYYGLMTLLVFPSHREGFPNVVLEAALNEVPAVGYRVTGVMDAIIDGETGRVVPFLEQSALNSAVASYLTNPSLKKLHGANARQRAISKFHCEIIWRAIKEAIDRRLQYPVTSKSNPLRTRAS